MGNVPSSPKIEQIVWFETRVGQWATTPTAFGLTAAEVTAFKTKLTEARVAYDAAQAAKTNAKKATLAQDEALRTMLDPGRDLVNSIKSFIEQSGNSALWSQAGITPDGPRGESPTPNPAFDLNASLDASGNVIVTWKTAQPKGVSGVIYTVRRSIDGGPFVLLDSVGEKEFVDDTVMTGTTTVQYTVQCKRGRKTSVLSPALAIRFGQQGGGRSAGRSISSVETTTVTSGTEGVTLKKSA